MDRPAYLRQLREECLSLIERNKLPLTNTERDKLLADCLSLIERYMPSVHDK